MGSENEKQYWQDSRKMICLRQNDVIYKQKVVKQYRFGL